MLHVPSTLGTPSLPSVSTDLSILGIPDKWNCTVYGHSLLTSFMEHVLRVHQCHSLYYCVILGCCRDVPHFTYPLIS